MGKQINSDLNATINDEMKDNEVLEKEIYSKKTLYRLVTYILSEITQVNELSTTLTSMDGGNSPDMRNISLTKSSTGNIGSSHGKSDKNANITIGNNITKSATYTDGDARSKFGSGATKSKVSKRMLSMKSTFGRTRNLSVQDILKNQYEPDKELIAELGSDESDYDDDTQFEEDNDDDDDDEGGDDHTSMQGDSHKQHVSTSTKSKLKRIASGGSASSINSDILSPFQKDE